MAMMHWGCWDVDTAVCWGQSQDLTSVLLGHLKKKPEDMKICSLINQTQRWESLLI